MLHAALSFSIFNTREELESKEDNGAEIEEALSRSVTIGDSIEVVAPVDSGEFSSGKKSMGLIAEEGEEEQQAALHGKIEEIERPVSPPLYLAARLGFDGYDLGVEDGDGNGGGGGGANLLTLPNFDERGDVEEYYTRMVDQHPPHPLFLSNYAWLLQSKGDLRGAEEYYHRESLADPGDGEILLQYAKLVWDLHRDQDRILSYFESPVQVALKYSHVLAAYASFLWEIDDEGEEATSQEAHVQSKKLDNTVTIKDLKPLHLPAALRIDVGDCNASDGGNVEEYYRKMVEENPSNSLVLRNYAQFLRQFKGNLQGAEEYYARAMLAESGDGETMSEYAKLIWEIHHDCDKAMGYFEQAVQASPENSHVLAAYASFLWEADKNEEDGSTSVTSSQ